MPTRDPIPAPDLVSLDTIAERARSLPEPGARASRGNVADSGPVEVAKPRVYEFTVPVAPVAKGRPRATAVGGFVRMYTPKKTETFEQAVAVVATRALSGACITTPVRLSCVFVVNRPGDMKTRSFIAKRGAGRVAHTTRGDVDNFAKAVMDGMRNCWTDDALVYDLRASKFYAAIGEAPHVAVRVEVDPPVARGGRG